MPLTTLIRRSSLPCPQISAAQALQLLAQHYGLRGSVKELGSQQDRNFLLEGEGGGHYVLRCAMGRIRRWNCRRSTVHCGTWRSIHRFGCLR